MSLDLVLGIAAALALLIVVATLLVVRAKRPVPAAMVLPPVTDLVKVERDIRRFEAALQQMGDHPKLKADRQRHLVYLRAIFAAEKGKRP